jgi:hypothetical protein
MNWSLLDLEENTIFLRPILAKFEQNSQYFRNFKNHLINFALLLNKIWPFSYLRILPFLKLLMYQFGFFLNFTRPGNHVAKPHTKNELL